MFKNYCVKNNIKCTKDNIRHWRDSHLYYSGFFDTPKIVWNKAKDFSNINNDVKEIIYKIGDDNCSEEDIIKIKVIANNENFNIFKNKKNIFKPVKISNVIIPNNSIKIEDMHLDGQFLNITENDLKEHNQRKLIKNSRIEKELSKIGENLLIIKFALVKNISIPFQVGITHSLANKDFTGPNDLNFFFKQRFYHS